MQIEILGTESLGVRGLSCFVSVSNRKFLIDPGIALGYKRHKLLPHPFQAAVDERIKKRILNRWQIATDIVLSHFHGDHVPLAEANAFQLHIGEVAGLNPGVRIWAKPKSSLSSLEKRRADDLVFRLDADFRFGSGGDEAVTFSEPFPHGDAGNESVMMTRMADAEKVFVHASDIQLLSDDAISRILSWKPDIALVDGPPIYLGNLSIERIKAAWKNALKLARGVHVLVLDHHLMRDPRGLEWLDDLAQLTGGQVICGADFMRVPRMLLEADRTMLYTEMPVPETWHENYAQGKANATQYWDKGREIYKKPV